MRDTVLSLCDLTGNMVKPWVDAGFHAILVDPQHPEGVTVDGRIARVGRIIDHPETWGIIRAALPRLAAVFGFPPCTDVAVSGSRWWDKKRAADPYFQCKATRVAEQCKAVGELAGVPWFFENPVSAFSGIFGRPQHTFQPWEFSGLEANDNYTKLTCLWAGGGFVMPAPEVHPEVAEAVALVVAELGRMVPKRKALEAFPADSLVAAWYPDNRIHEAPPSDDRGNIRSATPMGFSRAVFLSNAPTLPAANDNKPAPQKPMEATA